MRALFLALAALLALPAGASAAAPFGEWTVIGIGGDPVTGEVTLAISDDGIGGTGGCNRFFGAVTVDGATITFGAVGSTRMFCGGDGVMEQEGAFFAALQSVTRFEAAGNEMTLFDAAGVPVVVLAMPGGGTNGAAHQIVIPVPVPVDVATRSYACGKQAVTVDYINAGGISLAVLHMGEDLVVAANVLAASGARYAGDRYIWWSHGAGTDLYDLTGPGGDANPIPCSETP
ncbi:MAG: META domain-containing protein [Bauldia sp.]|nr:META domain-containing protein [Bauldia sp.]